MTTHPHSLEPRAATDPSNQRRLPPLLREAWYSLNQAFRRRINHLNITPDQFTILRWLIEGDPMGLTQRQLADLMASDPNTITSILNRMQTAGLIERKPHESDRRANRILVQSVGRKAFEKARQVAIKLQSEVLTILPEAGREEFLANLELLANSCREVAAKAPMKNARQPRES